MSGPRSKMTLSKAAPTSATDSVLNWFNEVLRVDGLEEAYHCPLISKRPPQSSEVEGFRQELITIFSKFKDQPDMPSKAVRDYIVLVHSCRGARQMRLMFSYLSEAVARGAVTPRVVCEELMSSEHLVHTNERFWNMAIALVKELIVDVDYKGVREIMKMVTEKSLSLPSFLDESTLRKTQSLYSLAELIFDRDACLLPGYFIINEILKVYSDNKACTHWYFSKLVTDFVRSFQPTAQMVSFQGRSGYLPIVDNSANPLSGWKLESLSLKFSIKGNLPYEKGYSEPQTKLLRYVLEHPYSRDIVLSMLGLQKQHKQRCSALEKELVELIVDSMARCEEQTAKVPLPHWQHLSSQLIYFVLFQFASFPHMVNQLKQKLRDFLPVMGLLDLLFDEKEPLPVPDVTNSLACHEMAAVCVWIHLIKKAQIENLRVNRPLPFALKRHNEYLRSMAVKFTAPNGPTLAVVGRNFNITLLCNAYSTNQEYFPRPMGALVERLVPTMDSVHGTRPQTEMPGSNCFASGPPTPLSLELLDSLTVHAKMSLIHNIVSHVLKLAKSKSTLALPPALVETYSRLLVYTEIESLGIKGFIGQLLPTVCQYQSFGILHTLLEMFSYRLQHIQPHYRMQLLQQLHNLSSVPGPRNPSHQTQLHLCVESTALRLITGLLSTELQPQGQLSRILAEPKNLISPESEELNRALVLVLARSIQITAKKLIRDGTRGESVLSTSNKELLNAIMATTPLGWSSHTLKCFPVGIREYFNGKPVQKENKQTLKVYSIQKLVEEEYRKWLTMTNESDIVAHFSLAGTPLFICLLWKMIMETRRINPIAYRVLERVGARALSAHLRTFCDYFVHEFSNSERGTQVNHFIDAVNDLIWKYHIFPIDRFILTLVFDIVIHRFLEIAPVAAFADILDQLLGNIGILYKFHNHPITYLYNLLHYYEARVRERPALKRTLVATIIGAQSSLYPETWALSQDYLSYIREEPGEVTWKPDMDYYLMIVNRLRATIAGESNPFADIDWRFNEFPNATAHALHITCVELMALPAQPKDVGDELINVIIHGRNFGCAMLYLHIFWLYLTLSFITRERDLLGICCIGPLLQRMHVEKPRALNEITVELYELLSLVEKSQPVLKYHDTICDLLYHIKYMFTGDMVKLDVVKVIRTLRPSLQKRFRFISHLSMEEIQEGHVTSTT
ncbi:unnamed protein product [Cyprideis torosa]|uniref:Mediator of RNA polymerase II transcription subunit 23 n=1 Tax=Cyprideis torosa TaxID=163714 RepID=A0A7R8ZT33_9CRUS|nr:unnamed protein product [Cyprideis torosa]CAG0897084.1 unnamed protein product [Cyprideis torosa]